MKLIKRTFQPINKLKMYTYLQALCWFTIITCNILKLFGYKNFQMPEFTYNVNIWIITIVNFIFYLIDTVLALLLLIKRKPTYKEVLISFALATIPFVISMFTVTYKFKMLFEVLIYIVMGFIFIKDKWYKVLFETVSIYVIVSIFQTLSLLYRNINVNIIVENFIVTKILKIDFYVMMVLIILRNMKKGGYIHDRWFRFLVVLSNKRRNEKSLFKNQKDVQESIASEFGFKMFTLMLSIFQFVLVGTLCYFINKVTWQFIIVFISFVFMRICFGKSYHCNKIITCTTLSCVSFLLATSVNFPEYMSVLWTVATGALLAYLMYVLYHFIKYTTSQGITLCVGMSEDALDALVSTAPISEIDYKILKCFYVDKKSITQIANLIGYSNESIKKHKAKTLKDLGFN